jgi:hypothetical protein
MKLAIFVYICTIFFLKKESFLVFRMRRYALKSVGTSKESPPNLNLEIQKRVQNFLTLLCVFRVAFLWSGRSYSALTLYSERWKLLLQSLPRTLDTIRISLKLKLKLKLYHDPQSFRQRVLVSGTHLGSATNFSFSLKFPLDSCGFVIFSTLSDERTGQ